MTTLDGDVLRALLELAPDTTVVVDGEGRMVYVNAQVERLFGYSRDELVGRPVEVLVPPAFAAAHPDRRTEYFADPRPRPMGAGVQLSARRRDGSEFPADISLSAIVTPAGPLVSAAIRDVTERLEAQRDRERLTLQAERDREERRRLESQRLESLGQLAGGVAHDFNNLLAVITNAAAFTREAIDEAGTGGRPDWPTARRDIVQVERAAEAAAALTRQLLAFARREVVRPRVLDLDAVVTSVEGLLERTLGTDVELVVRPGAGDARVEADPGQLEQLLLNVAINARHAMPSGGVLTIETTARTSATHPDAGPDRLVLRVSDTGHGMDAETASRAFEPFFTTKPSGQGTGLGLATVYGIVTQAGGEVSIESAPGEGTTLTAAFPVVRPRGARSAADDDPAAAAAGHETVLVLDDEPAVRDVVSRLLRRNGYTVLVAESGDEAIALARDHPGVIHALLTDVVMPKWSGPAVAAEIRPLRPSIRVLFMSGYAPPTTGAGAPGPDLLEKPFTEAVLLARLREVLDAPSRPSAPMGG